ncbi:hypothetical protein Shyhy02_66750 [Streptomyces hygroscopicus subsp. hygroscopicus]|nr:hypothetical protein Shyhy02_66750 [Streptomyces hygroscopicus subsp. hygroscopicus]
MVAITVVDTTAAVAAAVGVAAAAGAAAAVAVAVAAAAGAAAVAVVAAEEAPDPTVCVTPRCARPHGRHAVVEHGRPVRPPRRVVRGRRRPRFRWE